MRTTTSRPGRSTRSGARPALVVVVLVALVGVGLAGWGLVSSRDSPNVFSSVGLGPGAASRPAFPILDTSSLSPARQRILAVVHREYDANRPGTTFAEGVEEPWCADFVSTTMREAGVPLSNPNSGSWRIPGVATLTDYLIQSGRWRGPDHRPLPGDIVVYDKPSPLGQHTNIVIGVSRDKVTGEKVMTVGGNEADGVTSRTFDLGAEVGIQGYGVSPA